MTATISIVLWVDDQDLIADHDIVEAFILRHDLDHVARQDGDMNGARHSGADRDAKALGRARARRMALADRGADARTLVGRQLHRCAAR